jgi:hypothetical protein
LIVVVVIIFVLLAGGGLTSMLISTGGQVAPILQQVSAPDASPTTMLPWKANQFFILVGFVLFNLVGIAVTLAIIFWVVDRGVKRSKADAQQDQQPSSS